MEATARPETLIERVCADNPAGQATELTPVVLALQAMRPHRTRDDRKDLAGVGRHNPSSRTRDARNAAAVAETEPEPAAEAEA